MEKHSDVTPEVIYKKETISDTPIFNIELLENLLRSVTDSEEFTCSADYFHMMENAAPTLEATEEFEDFVELDLLDANSGRAVFG